MWLFVFCASTKAPLKGAPSGPFTVPLTVALCARGTARIAAAIDRKILWDARMVPLFFR